VKTLVLKQFAIGGGGVDFRTRVTAVSKCTHGSQRMGHGVVSDGNKRPHTLQVYSPTPANMRAVESIGGGVP
jgi:hypothetical protein